MKFLGYNEISVLKENFILSRNYDVILHCEFTYSLITQKLTLRQVVDYSHMAIYGTNMDPNKFAWETTNLIGPKKVQHFRVTIVSDQKSYTRVLDNITNI